MSSTLEHISHPKHLLRLKEDDVIGVDATCYGCNKPVIGSLTYTCTSHDLACENFYLHKSCAELQTKINHHKHNKHPLALLPRRNCLCNVCGRKWEWFTYTCIHCDFDVCMSCAFEQRVLRHEGHEEHTLTLMPREAFFRCDACFEEAKDSSYVCTTCDFWIHKSCAFSPFIIPAPTYHHHPLNLVYSIPDMHRYFSRYCAICDKVVQKNNWLYYCHKCTYFVHMKCAASTHTMVNEIEADGIDNEPDLVEFPLPSEESLFELIVSQCGKFLVDFQGEGEDNVTLSTMPNDLHTIEEHWSHNHSLEHLYITIGGNDSNENNDDSRVLICNGCIQPITVAHPSYYACILCGFFLHSFCATKLPRDLPRGILPVHPQHSLLLGMMDRFYTFVRCGVCQCTTNGFYYHCETCDIKFDIVCAFLPTRIKHKSHKHHSLVQRPFSNSMCSISRTPLTFGSEYACETCVTFQIHLLTAYNPSRRKHKHDLHPITLRHPPFFYEGVFYCEICEEQVHNQHLLYHCGECDYSFHHHCLGWKTNVKLGGTIKLNVSDQPHTLALVLKATTRNNTPPFICCICGDRSNYKFYFECDGCGYLVCCDCVIKILGE